MCVGGGGVRGVGGGGVQSPRTTRTPPPPLDPPLDKSKDITFGTMLTLPTAQNPYMLRFTILRTYHYFNSARCAVVRTLIQPAGNRGIFSYCAH